MTAGIDTRHARSCRSRGGGGLDADHEIQELGGNWVFAGELGYDFRDLTAEQVQRIAPFVVEAAWSRGLGPLLLIHGGDRVIAAELRAQWQRGDWMAWAYWRRSKRHRSMPTRFLLSLRPDPCRPRSPLPDFEPGSEEFETPTCVGITKAGKQCSAPAAAEHPYCAQHDPLKQGGT